MATAPTIVALATPPGIGGVAVVRVSGSNAPTIARALLGDLPSPRRAHYGRFRDAAGQTIDHGIALYFPAPHSFTGEDVLELHAHGAPIVVDLLIQRIVALGARLARPGEFSERAFLNGKLDLAQLEAIADLISAQSEAAARGALRSLEGEFSRRVHALVEELTRLRMYIEAAIDFPEEEIDFLADARIANALETLTQSLNALNDAAHQGVLLNSGMTVVLVGAPNVGKSSLLNALSGTDTAIVSDTPGTTRDIVRAPLNIDGLPLHVLDTAGLRASDDAIEREGMARARAAMTRADRVLLVLDDRAPATTHAHERAQLPPSIPCTLVYNKIDLTGRAPGVVPGPEPAIAISATSGAGIDALREHLKQCMGYQPAGEGTFIARRRHLEAIGRAHAHVDQAHAQLAQHKAGELVAEELRRAQQALGEITGAVTPEDLLERIFASFCIGK
ncbi:MAG: tRNA uridine-5-carboxymethylaminomethyl(34) synthesis GTPase MnmE [Gammaproteobacteria bacterium]